MSATLSATATIAACVVLTLVVFVIDAWAIRRMRQAILQIPRQDPRQDQREDPLDPDVD
jgi:hypothetical protein